MENCVFCKIISGEIPTEFVYRDEQIVAFKDINLSAPVHILIVPKIHIENLNEVSDKILLGELVFRAVQIAKEKGLADKEYKVVINVGNNLVNHLHFHLLGGWENNDQGILNSKQSSSKKNERMVTN